MLRYALQTVRDRKAGFFGAFVALLCAAALITACGTLTYRVSGIAKTAHGDLARQSALFFSDDEARRLISAASVGFVGSLRP